MDVRYFKTQRHLRRWLETNHERSRELNIGLYKKATGKPTVTYREALDEALCFGWIDGVRRSIDEESYAQRFSPRRRGSSWSLVNINRVEELQRLGRMHTAGLKAYEGRDLAKAEKHSAERGNMPFDSATEKRFKANRKAWAFFQAQPPGYRNLAAWWVMSAKKEETRERRLSALIDDSANDLRLPDFSRPRED